MRRLDARSTTLLHALACGAVRVASAAFLLRRSAGAGRPTRPEGPRP